MLNDGSSSSLQASQIQDESLRSRVRMMCLFMSLFHKAKRFDSRVDSGTSDRCQQCPDISIHREKTKNATRQLNKKRHARNKTNGNNQIGLQLLAFSDQEG